VTASKLHIHCFSFGPSFHTWHSTPTLGLHWRSANIEFAKALKVVGQVMRDGAVTHPEGKWLTRSPELHIVDAKEHMQLLREADPSQDHLAAAATRLLTAVTLR
jgi:hypothetical protein